MLSSSPADTGLGGLHGTAFPVHAAGRQGAAVGLHQVRELGHNYVGTEHLPLRLDGEGDSAAVQVLNGLGVDPETLRRE